MSGTPTEAEIQVQLRALVDIFETARTHIDGTMAGGGGKFDTLIQALEGEYTPAELTALIQNIRANYAAIVDPATVLAGLESILFEYAKILAASATDGYGSGFRDSGELMSALYEWLHDNSDSVQSRAITYGTPAADGGNDGDLVFRRLTVDRNGYDLEACNVEKKMARCIADQNSGVAKWAELFEVVGEAASFDGLLRPSFGSGENARTRVRAKHAGSGAGGSLCNNSSFSDFTASASSGEQFDGWEETLAGGAVYTEITQDTTNYYRSHPNATTDASCRLTMGTASASITLKQTLANMRASRLDPNTPYFARVMWNRSIGSGGGGSISLKVGGAAAVTVALAAQSGWQELIIPFDASNWFKGFNDDPFDIEVGWLTGTSGYVLLDDLIFAPWDLVDGTYLMGTYNSASPTAAQVDDFYTITDTGGAPSTGKIQYCFFISGLGYLPSDGAPTISDP